MLLIHIYGPGFHSHFMRFHRVLLFSISSISFWAKILPSHIIFLLLTQLPLLLLPLKKRNIYISSFKNYPILNFKMFKVCFSLKFFIFMIYLNYRYNKLLNHVVINMIHLQNTNVIVTYHIIIFY